MAKKGLFGRAYRTVTAPKQTKEPSKPKARGKQAPLPKTRPEIQAAHKKHDLAVGKILSKLDSPLPGLTPAQTNTVKKILATGQAMGATKKEMVSAVETGLVESNLSNPLQANSDGTSAGWRQEIDTYGPESVRRNIKGAAKRYFEETAAMGRGQGQTAGQLAADVQRPLEKYRGRYDERRTEAQRITKAFNRRSKAAAKAGVEYADVNIAKPKKLAGPWAGSKRVAMQATRGYEKSSLKRTPEHNQSVGGSSTSDHLTTSGRSFAVDISTTDGEGIARNIAKRLGIKGYTTGNYTRWTTNKPGYSAQILWNVSGHTDHVHVGIRWENRALPAGTVEGGYGAPAATSGGGTGTSASGTASAKKRKKKDKERKPSFFDLGQFDPLKGTPAPKLSKAPKTDYEKKLKRRKVDLG